MAPGAGPVGTVAGCVAAFASARSGSLAPAHPSGGGQSGGAQAIASWREQSYDVILMGCQMPGLDGFATAAAIREEETLGRRIPIIALSSEATREIARSSPDSMDGYLHKPVSLDQLRVALERYVTPNEQPSNARPADPVRSRR